MQNQLGLLASAAFLGASNIAAYAQERSPWSEDSAAEARVFVRIPLAHQASRSESAVGLGVYRSDANCDVASAAFAYAACAPGARRGMELRVSNDIVSVWATGGQDAPILAWGDPLRAEGEEPDTEGATPERRAIRRALWVIGSGLTVAAVAAFVVFLDETNAEIVF